MNPITEIQALPQALSPLRRYDRLAVCFHWAVFLLVALAYSAIELKGSFAKGTPPRALAMTVHEWAGALVLVLAVPRLVWRLVRGAPAGCSWPARPCTGCFTCISWPSRCWGCWR